MIWAQAGPLLDWGWVVDHLEEIRVQTWEHVYLTVLAVGIGFVISMGLSALALAFRPAYGPITAVAGLLYTIPSIALFVLLLPFFGFSVTTVEVALVGYTLLILVRNIVAGLDGVPAAIRESAEGMGYRRGRLFWEIELPLALPVIIAGIRIATVSTIGLVTVGALVTVGGVGEFILAGLRGLDTTPILVGAVLSVALAVVFDGALVLVERLLTPWARRRAGA